MFIKKRLLSTAAILVLGLVVGAASTPSIKSAVCLPFSTTETTRAVYSDFSTFHGFVLDRTPAEHLDQISLGLATHDKSESVRLGDSQHGPLAMAWRGKLLRGATGLGGDVEYGAVFLQDKLVVLRVMPLLPPGTTLVDWFNAYYDDSLGTILDPDPGTFVRIDRSGNELGLEEAWVIDQPDGRAFLEFRSAQLEAALRAAGVES